MGVEIIKVTVGGISYEVPDGVDLGPIAIDKIESVEDRPADFSKRAVDVTSSQHPLNTHVVDRNAA